MPYDIETIRKNLAKAVSGKFNDPDEFRPEKAKENSEIKYRFFILPPFKSGDIIKGGPATHSMDNFFIANGSHWINSKPHACPRVWDNSDCPICQYGFDLLKECKEQRASDDRKQQIRSQCMPSTYYMVNIFFTNWKGNPEDLRGKVKFFNAPKTCLDKWMSTLMKDDKGDAEDPDAYGVFFDESSAFCFELIVTKEGKNNGYKTSGFIKNNGNPVPMIMNEDRTPNRKKLDQLLELRIDLFSKIEIPDHKKISRLASVMINGDDDDDDNKNGGFDDDETTTASNQPSHQSAVKSESKTVTKSEAKSGSKSSSATTTKDTKVVSQNVSARKPQSKQDDDDDDMLSNDLSDEAPISDSNDSNDSSNSSDSTDVGGDDIESLLSQLDD